MSDGRGAGGTGARGAVAGGRQRRQGKPSYAQLEAALAAARERIVGLEQQAEERERRLTEGLEQQTATAEVLADKNMASHVDGSKKDYSRPLALFKRHPDSAKVFNDTVDSVFARNEKPLEDAFRPGGQAGYGHQRRLVVRVPSHGR